MEENGKKICSLCGQENESGYIYCKNCGTLLGDDTIKSELAEDPYTAKKNAEYKNYGDSMNQGAYGFYSDGIDGIPAGELALFIGKKSPAVIAKFSAMQQTGSKISWCWPVALLSILFGPLGAAVWFFYRKMYKNAFILSAVGAALSIALGILRGDSAAFGDAVYNAMEEGGQTLGQIISQSGTWRVLLASRIENFINIATAVLTGLFSMTFYKHFAVSAIYGFRRQNGDPRYYRIGLSAIGGTSGGMAWVGVLFIIAANAIGSFLGQLTNLL